MPAEHEDALPPVGSVPPTDGESSVEDAAPPGGWEVPPGGWEVPPELPEDQDADALAALIEQLLMLVPAEVRDRLVEAVRQLLEALRALLDWCVERLGRQPAAAAEVHDIPIL